MGGTFDERTLRFVFGASWRVLHFDKSNTLRIVSRALQSSQDTFGVRSVDFVALDDRHRLWLVEATDCSASTDLSVDIKGTRHGKVGCEFGSKALCTIGAIIGAARFGKDEFDWKAAAKSLHDDTFHCVLFSEEPALAGRIGGRRAQEEQLASAFGWLTKRVKLVDTSDYANTLPDVVVSRIPKS